VLIERFIGVYLEFSALTRIGLSFLLVPAHKLTPFLVTIYATVIKMLVTVY